MEKLTGTVELDDDSLTRLRISIREECIKELIEKQNFSKEEIKDILRTFSTAAYFDIIKCTVVMRKRELASGNPPIRHYDFKQERILDAIEAILSI